MGALTVMSLGYRQPWQFLARLFFTPLFAVLGRFKPLPQLHSPMAWSFKQLGFVADHLMLAATSHGFAAACMEGLSSDAARSALRIPSNYVVMCAVSIGKPDMEQRWAPRYPP